MGKARNQKSIRNASRILSGLVKLGDVFFVGVTLDEYKSCTQLDRFKLKKTPIENDPMMPAPTAGVSKVNIVGKFVRVQPEQKHTVRKHIRYIRRKDGTKVEYDRDFNIFKKELKYNFNIPLMKVTTDESLELVVSPVLVFEPDDLTNALNTHVINIFLQIFGRFEVFTERLEPAIKYHHKYDFQILPSGEIEENIRIVVEGLRMHLTDEKKIEQVRTRLDFIAQFNPKTAALGADGFRGYIVFEFGNKSFVLVESVYTGNATYVFNSNDYAQLISKDKQELISNHLYRKRIFHNKSWEENITRQINES